MTQPAKVQEPSMEEILASIRRIIADDEAQPADPVAAASAGANAAQPKEARIHNIAAVPSQPPALALDAAPKREEPVSMTAAFDKVVPHPAHAEADVFDLTDEMAVSPPPFRTVEPDDVEFAEPPPPVSEYVPPPPPRPAMPKPAPAQTTADILSQSTASAVESAFSSLASTVLSNNARTLEDIVREMMRPMLKSWLDDNLPSLVERIVRAEIERVARGR